MTIDAFQCFESYLIDNFCTYSNRKTSFELDWDRMFRHQLWRWQGHIITQKGNVTSWKMIISFAVNKRMKQIFRLSKNIIISKKENKKMWKSEKVFFHVEKTS